MKPPHRNTFLSFALALLLCAPLHADDTAAKQAKIQELFNLMHMQQTFENVIDQAGKQGAQTAMSMFPGVKLTPEQQKVLDSNLEKIGSVIREGLAWSKLQPEFTKLYAENYSEATVDGLLAFYRSPAGQDLLAKQSTIMAQSGAIVQQASVSMQPRMQEIMKEMALEMQKATPPAK